MLNTSNGNVGVLTNGHNKTSTEYGYYIPPYTSGLNYHSDGYSHYLLSDAEEIGKIQAATIKCSGNFDYAVYEPKADMRMKGTALNSQSCSLWGGVFPVGWSVKASGHRVPAATGTIVSNSFSEYNKEYGATLTNLYTTDIVGKAGNSGGPLMAKDSNGKWALTGMCNGPAKYFKNKESLGDVQAYAQTHYLISCQYPMSMYKF